VAGLLSDAERYRSNSAMTSLLIVRALLLEFKAQRQVRRSFICDVYANQTSIYLLFIGDVYATTFRKIKMQHFFGCLWQVTV
jgi:hypothetical protein